MSREKWWLDYMEGELTPAMRPEVKKSIPKEFVEDLNEIKDVLKASDPAFDLSEDRMDFLFDKIMANLDKAEMAPAPRVVRKSVARKALTPVLMLLMLAITPTVLQDAGFSLDQQRNHALLEEGADHPAELVRLVSYQSEADFLVDAAAQNFDDLSIKEFEKLLGERQL